MWRHRMAVLAAVLVAYLTFHGGKQPLSAPPGPPPPPHDDAALASSNRPAAAAAAVRTFLPEVAAVDVTHGNVSVEVVESSPLTTAILTLLLSGAVAPPGSGSVVAPCTRSGAEPDAGVSTGDGARSGGGGGAAHERALRGSVVAPCVAPSPVSLDTRSVLESARLPASGASPRCRCPSSGGVGSWLGSRLTRSGQLGREGGDGGRAVGSDAVGVLTGSSGRAARITVAPLLLFRHPVEALVYEWLPHASAHNGHLPPSEPRGACNASALATLAIAPPNDAIGDRRGSKDAPRGSIDKQAVAAAKAAAKAAAADERARQKAEAAEARAAEVQSAPSPNLP